MLTVTSTAGVTTLALAGDLATVPADVRASFIAAAAGAPGAVLVDLTGVTALGTAGLELCYLACRSVRRPRRLTFQASTYAATLRLVFGRCGTTAPDAPLRRWAPVVPPSAIVEVAA